jgi:hypothetical protein
MPRLICRCRWSKAATVVAFDVSERAVVKWIHCYRAGCRSPRRPSASRRVVWVLECCVTNDVLEPDTRLWAILFGL